MKIAKPALIAIAAVALVGALAYALMDKPSAPASTFTTLEGKPLALDELRGKVVELDMDDKGRPLVLELGPDPQQPTLLVSDSAGADAAA